MILFDDAVTLRAIDEDDAPVLFEMINDPEIESSVVGYSYPVSLSQQKKWISDLKNDSTIHYAVDYENELVGVVSVSSLDFKNRCGDLNIKLIHKVRGKGVATRAMNLLINYCFEELNLNCICADVLEENDASNGLWKKLGFHFDGLLRQRVYKNGKYHNLCLYSLLRDEFYERNRK